MRRKAAPVKVGNVVDDRKLHEVTKKAGLQEVGQPFDDAFIAFDDDSVIMMRGPKFFIPTGNEMQANTIVVMGQSTKTSMSKLQGDMGAAMSAGAGAGGDDVAPPTGSFEAEDQD